MLLALNIGNTNLLVGLIEDGEIITSTRFRIKDELNFTKTLSDIPESEYFTRKSGCFKHSTFKFRQSGGGLKPNRLVKNITGAIISSVNPSKTKLLETAVKELFKITPRIVEAVTPHYNGKVGVDRYVICRAAASKYSPPLIVFDFGTATTINVIDANGHFIGGSILAGMMTGVNALASSTALLPKIELSSNAPLIGRNTEECISSGAVFGNASLLDGMVSRIEPNATVVVTGGNAEYVIPFCKTEVIHEPDLLLKGLVLLESDT